MTQDSPIRQGLWACLAAMMMLAWPVDARAEVQEVAAAWKHHEFDFHYMGFTTRYSCEGLRDKVRLLLRYSGVVKGVKVTTRGCEVGHGFIATFPRVRVIFEAPEIPEAGQRVVGETTLGRWRSVSIRRGQPRGLEVGDCELVEQFRDRLLPLLTHRNVNDRTNCIPHQLLGSVIDLKFDLLVALPTPDAPAQLRR